MTSRSRFSTFVVKRYTKMYNFIEPNRTMIKDYFRSFNLFSDGEIDELTKNFVPHHIGKHDYFVKQGDPCRAVAFIRTGVFRSFNLSDDGTENTFCFRFPNNLLAPYSAFITGGPSMETMQAITVAEVLVIQKKEMERLMDGHPNWTLFLKHNAEHEYLELEKRFFQLQKESATQRYVSLMENQPEFIQQIPLQYLASYLGVTQRHLSRIRKEITF